MPGPEDRETVTEVILPEDHPQRSSLNDEAHARPPELLVPPQRLSYLALFAEESARERQWRQLCDLVERFDVPPPEPGANHYGCDLGPFRVKWERHSEFTRYKFIVAGVPEDPFSDPAILAVPRDWLSGLSGQVMAAAHVVLVRDGDEPSDYEAMSGRVFGGNVLIGAGVAGGAATALTDFRIHGDRFSRFILKDRNMTPRQAGRTVQRLLEIDTYRVMALLALPVAQGLSPLLGKWERELSEITAALAAADERDEPGLLDRLTLLAGEITGRESESRYRFGAAAAYYGLVQRRILDLRETRIQGLQTFKEFTERRLAPAMSTCRSVAERRQSLSREVAQATQLLATRVGMTRERQNQALLESMNRRAKLQLRLQQTVEGLSIAAITYYIVRLIGYASKGLVGLGVAVDPDLVMAASIPIVVVLIALGVRRIRKAVTQPKA